MPHPSPDQELAEPDLELIRRVLGGDRRVLRELSSRLECVARILRVRNRKNAGALDEQLLDPEAQA